MGQAGNRYGLAKTLTLKGWIDSHRINFTDRIVAVLFSAIVRMCMSPVDLRPTECDDFLFLGGKEKTTWIKPFLRYPLVKVFKRPVALFGVAAETLIIECQPRLII